MSFLKAIANLFKKNRTVSFDDNPVERIIDYNLSNVDKAALKLARDIRTNEDYKSARFRHKMNKFNKRSREILKQKRYERDIIYYRYCV